MEVLPHDQFVVRIYESRRLTRRNIRLLRLYNPISTTDDLKAFHGWRRSQPISQKDNVGHQTLDSPSMFSDDSNELMRQIKLMGIIRMLGKSTLLLLWYP